ncbi:MAG: CPBP family intramembrane glutamic endopeptidase [Eggerthellaceae bacterium]
MSNRHKVAVAITYLGMGIMVALTCTQLFPSLQWAGFAVVVGLAGFFIVESVAGTPAKKSSLRFSTMPDELKNRTVWLLIGILACLQITYVVVGNLVFGHAYIDYDMGRTFAVMNSESIVQLLVVLPVSAWGEEIAWRGFFLGLKPQKAPFWVWALLSSVLFAIGHVSTHAVPLVMFGISGNFLCSLILCRLFLETNNCMISTIGHIVGNYAEILFIMMVFWG